MVNGEAAAASEERWVEGRNGGKLRVGGKHGGPRRANVVVQSGLREALRDPRGGSGKEFWVKLKTGSSEDKRTFANVVAKLIPIEVAGSLGMEGLTVLVQTLVATDGAREMHTPRQGTCVIAENDAIAPTPAPITVKIDASADEEER